MAKDVLVIDKINGIAYHCSKTDAGKIVGVTRNTIYAWKKEHERNGKTIKEKYHFIILFDYEEIKIKRGFKVKL